MSYSPSAQAVAAANAIASNLNGAGFSAMQSGTVSKTPIEAVTDGIITGLQTLTWTSVASSVGFTNGWTDFGAPYNTVGYVLDAAGFVHLRGLIKSGTMTLPAFTLPVGYRPLGQCYFGTVSNNAHGDIFITTAGAVTPEDGSNAWISLDNIHFYVG